MKTRKNDRVSATWLNGMVLAAPHRIVTVSERIYRNQIRATADEIARRSTPCSILLVSGPSGSSKTTTAGKLSAELAKHGIRSVVVSLDNFFVNRDQLPKLPNGDTDFESVKTLDMAALDRCFDELVGTGASDFPIFDFTVGRRSSEVQRLEVDEETIVILEGIHALCPEVVEGHDPSHFLKLYISPNSDYYQDDLLLLNAQDVRLIRRMVRDYFYRGNTVDSTLAMWVNVVASERQNILPYRDSADFQIDSAILYEPNVYGSYLEQILAKSEISEKYQAEISRLRKALEYFVPLGSPYIPEDTVLHEFLGV